jgi:TatD DNase family protein
MKSAVSVKVFSTITTRHLSFNDIKCGSVGLDFSPHIVRGKELPEDQYREIQRQVFRKQIALAIDADLPLNVHSR